MHSANGVKYEALRNNILALRNRQVFHFANNETIAQKHIAWRWRAAGDPAVAAAFRSATLPVDGRGGPNQVLSACNVVEGSAPIPLKQG